MLESYNKIDVRIYGQKMTEYQRFCHPNVNYMESIHDPAQAYNVISVGAYTTFDKLPDKSEDRVLVPKGGMSPFTTTSLTWDSQWPIKPDIVMEGGNLSTNGDDVQQAEVLKLLSLDAEYPKFSFLPFGGTSAAAALVAKMAAELRTKYPDYWPETIRGLLIHSAEYTQEMLKISSLKSENERRTLLRTVGYGVPNITRAISSTESSLTLICERWINPYRLKSAKVTRNQYHLFELPWPRETLLNEVGAQNARITVTLSYFIEPNPGNKQYANSYSYETIKSIRKERE